MGSRQHIKGGNNAVLCCVLRRRVTGKGCGVCCGKKCWRKGLRERKGLEGGRKESFGGKKKERIVFGQGPGNLSALWKG